MERQTLVLKIRYEKSNVLEDKEDEKKEKKKTKTENINRRKIQKGDSKGGGDD